MAKWLYLSSKRFGESTRWLSQVSLKVFYDRLREGQLLGAVLHHLTRQFVLYHELCQISNHLGGWRHLKHTVCTHFIIVILNHFKDQENSDRNNLENRKNRGAGMINLKRKQLAKSKKKIASQPTKSHIILAINAIVICTCTLP